MMAVGLTSLSSAGLLSERLGSQWDFIILPGLCLLFLTWLGAACTLMRQHWKWALTGAICSVVVSFVALLAGLFGLILPILSMLAFFFLVKRKAQFKDFAA